MRRRRSDEERRYAAPQRSGRIDANPHQIEAVIFALSRLGDGGCILADEVGLGKTIEAGLVMAQLRAEGARRILLITPKALLGQWRQELHSLFGMNGIEVDAETIFSDGVLMMGREAAGSEKGKAALLGSPPFDLIVIDEAHEIFGGLHRRFDGEGGFREEAAVARTAGRVFEFIQAGQAPVLLLTATPIQNSLVELWALVRFVDRSGTLLGDLTTFRQTFCVGGDRELVSGQAGELQRRVKQVLRRTLRRQAQEFLSKPFVDRQARLFEYPMQPDERALYDDVTAYLMSRNLAAFRGNQRRLLLIGFHRRMASSTAALASSLEKVADRLQRMSENLPVGDALLEEFTRDLEDDELTSLEDAVRPEDDAPTLDAIKAELQQVRSFVERAKAVRIDGKSQALLKAARLIGQRKKASGKMVIFTESKVTQEYLAQLLVAQEIVTEQEVTLFRGQNDSTRAKEALDRWKAEVGDKLDESLQPSRDIAARLALVHEFRTRSKIFISTEAGAKGLNLQFCETVINYDLPWNPQRIEQRIGRCHRYGQELDVTVINFLAEDNETERLVFQILSEKLELFGTVLDASDAVLHRASKGSPESLASALGTDLETNLSRIWERARTRQDVEVDLRELRDKVGEARQRFDDEQDRTANLIESYFDDEVRKVFLKRREELPRALKALDEDLERLVVNYLDFIGVPHQLQTVEDRLLVIPPNAKMPGALARGLTVAVGASARHDSLHLSHPMVMAAIASARAEPVRKAPVALRLPADAHPDLLARRGGLGRLIGVLAHFEGLEKVDRLVPVAVCEGEDRALAPALAQSLLKCAMRNLDEPVRPAIDDVAMEDAVEEVSFDEGRELGGLEQARFDRSVEQLEHYVEDRARLLRRQKTDQEHRLESARAQRDKTVSADARDSAEAAVVRVGKELEELDAKLERLAGRDDETYRRCREELFTRRFKPTSVERLFDVEFMLE